MAEELKNRKKILILKSSLATLASVDGFLHSRGWEVLLTTDVQETIKIVLSKKPEYLLICANHPQKTVKALPKVLLQAVTIKILVYVDFASVTNMNLLHAMGYSNYILPPVSGPAIERAIFKFEKDRNQNQLGKRKSPKGIVGNFSEFSKEPSAEHDFIINRSLDNSDLEFAINQSLRNSMESENSPMTFSEYEDLKRNQPAALMPEDSNSRIITKDQLLKSNLQFNISQEDKNNGFAKQPDSIMVKGAQQALDATVKFNLLSKKVEKVEGTQNYLCILIDSTRFSGYLIAALGKNRRFDDEFVNTIQKKLYGFLKAQGEKLDEETPLEIKIKSVEFEDWALEEADFLKKAIHNGNEVAMSFFPTKKTIPDLEPALREDMLKISIEDLHGDIQVLFDVYIYLPINNKYVLFTPKGGKFFSDQKERLRQKGITHMHMKKGDISAAKKYTAETYLNNRVADFNTRKKDYR